MDLDRSDCGMCLRKRHHLSGPNDLRLPCVLPPYFWFGSMEVNGRPSRQDHVRMLTAAVIPVPYPFYRHTILFSICVITSVRCSVDCWSLKPFLIGIRFTKVCGVK